MARGDKPIELRPVDESSEAREEVVRLANDDIDQDAPVRLAIHPDDPKQEDRRLEILEKEAVNARSFEPGIEALIELPETLPTPQDPDWGRNPSAAQPTPWGWFALIAVVLTGGVIWSLLTVRKADKLARQIAVETESVLGKDADEEQQATDLIERIEATTREFFKAATVGELAKNVRHRDRVEPLMAGYYSNHRLIPQRVMRTDMLQPLTLGGRANFWMESVELETLGKKNLAIEVMPGGEIKIDWETLVCYQPMPWDEFATNRPEATSLDFRVYVEPDNFHSHEFADPNQWECVRMTALDSDETLFGYCRANSESARIIAQTIGSNAGRKTPMILRLNIPTGLQSRRGVVIESVLSSRWIYIEPPDPDL